MHGDVGATHQCSRLSYGRSHPGGSPLRFGIYGIFIILIPQHGVGLDVIRFVLQILCIANDVFVKIALPDRRTLQG